ncbi:DUF6502 family protein [Piscinibacter terrae]|uniref:DUF6502 family protein n=1 Tax=Piscinibacter terrae TaxID=2496871 RepID=UPI0018E091C4|nr:DUF6502 family protein [Albitalea terrae]
MSAVPSSVDQDGADQAMAGLLQACRAVMAPLAQLAVAHGLRHGDLDELMRSAFVDAARAAHADTLPLRAVSRMSAATGLTRREVSRLMRNPQPDAPRRSLATQLFTRWLSDPAYRRDGEALRELPRTGKAPSFQSLARAVTQDVHPRTLLDELGRLGLASHDERRDTVVLLRDTFVPHDDQQRMLGFLAANVGDHLQAAVSNVRGAESRESGPRHLEQALFADELSPESIERLQPVVRQQWQAVLKTLAPVVQQMIDEDEALDRPRRERLRVGMYAYSAPMAPAQGQATVPGAANEEHDGPATRHRRPT